MRLILHWIFLTLGVLAAAHFVPGIEVKNFLTALVVAAVLGFLNMIVKPIIKVLTLPINIITLGLFSLIINGVFFWFVTLVVPGFSVKTFLAAFWGALIVSIINWLGNRFLKKED